jgi:hypothetical protein
LYIFIEKFGSILVVQFRSGRLGASARLCAAFGASFNYTWGVKDFGKKRATGLSQFEVNGRSFRKPDFTGSSLIGS